MSEDDAPIVVAKPTAMVRWEYQVGYLVAGIAAAGGVTVVTSGHSVKYAGDLFSAATFGILVIAAALLLAAAVHHGHRLLAAMVGIPSLLLTRYLPIEVAVMVLVILLVMRTSNAQSRARRGIPRKTSAERRAAEEARIAAKKLKHKTPAAPGASNKPAANRRYTPPKPKPQRPVAKPDPKGDAKGEGKPEAKRGDKKPTK